MTSNELDKLKGVIKGQTKKEQVKQPVSSSNNQASSQPQKQVAKQPGIERNRNERSKFKFSGKGHIEADAFDIINSEFAKLILKDSTDK